MSAITMVFGLAIILFFLGFLSCPSLKKALRQRKSDAALVQLRQVINK